MFNIWLCFFRLSGDQHATMKKDDFSVMVFLEELRSKYGPALLASMSFVGQVETEQSIAYMCMICCDALYTLTRVLLPTT